MHDLLPNLTQRRQKTKDILWRHCPACHNGRHAYCIAMNFEQLDIYACMVDGMHAQISVDCRLAERAPILGLPFLAWVCLDLIAPDAEGLLHQSEQTRVERLEQALVEAVHDGRTGVYCGSCTTNGQRDYLFYLAEASRWEQRAGRVMAAFPEYRFHCSSHMETRWDTYFQFLFPEETEMPSLQAHALCAGLQRRNISVRVPRLLAHKLSFCSVADRDNFCRQACEEGFMPETEEQTRAQGLTPGTTVPAAGLPGSPQRVRLCRTDPPETAERVIMELKELAEAHGGSYEALETDMAQAVADSLA